MNGSRSLKGTPWYTRRAARAVILGMIAAMLVMAAPRARAQGGPAGAPGSGPPAAAPAVPPAPVRADREWLKAVYEKVAVSVVLIETEGGTGSGFFFYSPRLVATALHVVDDAEIIVIRTMDGRRYPAHVVAYSRANDVALVQIDAIVPDARPLSAHSGSVEIGETVAVIGHPFSGLEHQMPSLKGLLNWSLTQGVVSAVSGSWIQTDAAINPGNSGGPVLNGQGEVVGVVSAKLTQAQGIGMVARVERVKDLFPKIGQQGPPRHVVAYDGFELGFLLNWVDEQTIDGLALGVGARFMKRYPVRFRLGFLGGDIEPESPTVLSSRLERFSTEVTFGYAFPFGEYFELAPTLGLALFYDRLREDSLRIDSGFTCTGSPCYVEGRALHETTTDWRLLPTFGASLDFAHLRVAYAYQLDLSGPENSEHRMLFALNF